MSKVVFILIDGLRSDAISAAGSPTLWQFRQLGACTLQAQSVMPSMTLPCHTSIFHSVPPTRHGITTNTWSPMARPLPGLMEQAQQAGKRCAFFTNWEQLRDLSRPGSLEMAYCLNTSEIDLNSDNFVADAAIQYITSANPDFAFVYLGTLDTAGHWYSWMSEEYLTHLAKVDQIVARLLAALPGDTTVLLQSDHGGHDRSHGTEMPEDMTIPWMVRGAGIKQGFEIQEAVGLLDTAPTLARLLGVPPAPQWEGRVIESIFA